jgi:hypothetical protein
MIIICLEKGDRRAAEEYSSRGIDPSLKVFLLNRERGVDLEQEEQFNKNYINGCYVETE